MGKDKSSSRLSLPAFLLPTLKFPLRPGRSIDFSVPSSSSPESQANPTPVTALRVSRTQPDTLRCSTCSTDLAFASQIVSKGFTGRHGRAYLVAPPTDPSAPTSYSTADLINIRVARCESRQLVTGWHTVADISCLVCHTKLGWKYVDAKEHSQRYKVGKFILETERVLTYKSWEDVPASPRPRWQQDPAGGAAGQGPDVEFDSDDDDECDEIFAGTWNPDVVAKRRSRQVSYERE
ncbi:unnamed protein product [Parascedosporium putredinis]|uniref:Yippee domain-containing protein n=1 Tax=Parascedosporium putredinis TaxID=1442378 RepID=A0A9P1M9V0_9PEZI|nr:unnamed protein product [Parascedosporium putredinis]CAI7995481.1 unnamed protein product [Parascedosporium putredinis]